MAFRIIPKTWNVLRRLNSSISQSKNISSDLKFSLESGDEHKQTKILREPRGYVASQRWITSRPTDTKVEATLFPSVRSVNQSVEDRFLSSEMRATLSGAPTTQDFTYEETKSVSDIPTLDYRLYENLSRMGIDQLTPIQRHAIGIMSIDESINIRRDSCEFQRVVGKYDLMAAAQTGSGKTLAYLIPMVNRFLRIYPYEAMQARLKSNCQFPSGLILAPTRELVQQISSEVLKLCYRSFLRPVCLFGGERPPRQLYQLSLGCHLLVATPGRLLDFLRQKLLRLDHCRSLVLDEADRMLDMGFEEQLREILEAPEFGMPAPSDSERQTCLYSATFPREVTLLARNFLRGSRCISLTLSDASDQFGMVVPDWGKTARRTSSQEELDRLSRMVPREITQRFEAVPKGSSLTDYLVQRVGELVKNQKNPSDGLVGSLEGNKPRQVSDPANKNCRILVFCNTKREVDMVNRALGRRSLESAAIHGDKAQTHRTRVLEWFRQGRINVLVASSVAARGLDIPNVRAVINVGLPLEVEDYVHRIGRTGRMGHAGEAITVVNEELLERSSRSVARGILHLVQHSMGTIDGVPDFLLHLARWNPSTSNSFEVDDEDIRPRFKQKPGYLSKSSQFMNSPKKKTFNRKYPNRYLDHF